MKVTLSDCLSPVEILGLDFLDPAYHRAFDAVSGDFMKAFTTKLKDESSDENRLLLHRRYQ